MGLLAFTNAMTAIYNGDAEVATLTGRSTLNLRPRSARTLAEVDNLPVTTYEIIAAPQKPGTQGNREVTVRFGAWARVSAKNVIATIDGLLVRVEALFFATNFNAQGIDAGRRSPIGLYRDGGEDNDVRWSFLDMEFDVEV